MLLLIPKPDTVLENKHIVSKETITEFQLPGKKLKLIVKLMIKHSPRRVVSMSIICNQRN